jgi:hypothetical protein
LLLSAGAPLSLTERERLQHLRLCAAIIRRQSVVGAIAARITQKSNHTIFQHAGKNNMDTKKVRWSCVFAALPK